MPYAYKDEWNIAFNNLQGAVSACYHALENRKKVENEHYVIIYLSPVREDEATKEEKRIYIRLKEMFLFMDTIPS